MSTLALRRNCVSAQADEAIEHHLRGLLARLNPHSLACERRKNGRYPFPHLLELTPVDPDTTAPLGPAIVVVGKELSLRGLGFFHPFPLSYRRACVSLEDAEGRRLCLLIDLSWCRFTRHGWYESGGRFLQLLDGPAESEAPYLPPRSPADGRPDPAGMNRMKCEPAEVAEV